MKYIISLILILILSFSAVQAQSIDIITEHQDSVKVISLEEVVRPATSIPTIPFPPEAKIRVWWPDGDTKYFMPNAIEPNTFANEVRVFKWRGGQKNNED